MYLSLWGGLVGQLRMIWCIKIFLGIHPTSFPRPDISLTKMDFEDKADNNGVRRLVSRDQLILTSAILINGVLRVLSNRTEFAKSRPFKTLLDVIFG